VAFHYGQGEGRGSSANGRPRLGGSAYANLSPDLREYTPSTLDPHISGQGRDRRDISTVLERGIKGLFYRYKYCLCGMVNQKVINS